MGSVNTLTDGQIYQSGAYTADITAFNAGTLTEGAGYTESLVVDDSLFPNDLLYSWNWPAALLPSIHSFLSLSYGNYDDGVPQTPIVSSQLNDLETLTDNVNFSLSGDTAGFDVINDMFLTATAGGGSAHVAEVEVFHATPGYTQAWVQSSAVVGSFWDSGIDWNVYAETENDIPDYIVVPANFATVSGSIDLAGILDNLVSEGQLSGNLYFNGMAFGVETESGAGSMNLNNDSVVYSTNAPIPFVSIGLQQATGSITSNIFYTSDAALVGKAEPGANVAIHDGATLLANVTANALGVWNYAPAALPMGYNNLIATETDTYGNSASASVLVQFMPLALSISEGIQYVNGQGIAGVYTKIPTFNGWTAPGATVTLHDASTVLGQITADSNGYWSFTPTGLFAGLNDIVASAHDVYGRTATNSKSLLYYSNGGAAYGTIPTVSLTLANATGALEGSTLYTTDPSLVGAATANALVTIYNGQTILGTTWANASGNWSFSPTGLANGFHALSAQVAAGNGLVATASLAIDLNEHPINLSERIESVSGQGWLGVYTVDPTLDGWTVPGGNVYLSDGAHYLGAVAANSSGFWTYQTEGLTIGSHDILASAHDSFGRSANTAKGFVYEN